MSLFDIISRNYVPDDDYNYKFGGHTFVLARYKNGWQNFQYNTGFKNDEFVPCMISGNPSHKWQKRNFWIFGQANSHNIDEFEIIKGSDKELNDIISLYTNSKKYNL